MPSRYGCGEICYASHGRDKENKLVVKEIGIRSRLSTVCRQGVLTYFGHLVNHESDRLEKLADGGKYRR